MECNMAFCDIYIYISGNINCLVEYLKSIFLATSKCMLLLVLPVYIRSQKKHKLCICSESV